VEVIDVQLVNRLRRIGAIDDRDPGLVAGFETEVPVHQGGTNSSLMNCMFSRMTV
jgi:hypothetical protein